MKKLILAMALSALSSHAALAATESCQQQKNALESKIENAKSHGNTDELNSLNIALDKVNTYCTDQRQFDRAEHNLKKKERKVKKEQLDLEEAQSDLAEAKADGDQQKIEKKEKKLKEKTEDLAEAKARLTQAQADYNKLKK